MASVQSQKKEKEKYLKNHTLNYSRGITSEGYRSAIFIDTHRVASRRIEVEDLNNRSELEY